jgi:hypothetical protein
MGTLSLGYNILMPDEFWDNFVSEGQRSSSAEDDFWDEMLPSRVGARSLFLIVYKYFGPQATQPDLAARWETNASMVSGSFPWRMPPARKCDGNPENRILQYANQDRGAGHGPGSAVVLRWRSLYDGSPGDW